MIASSMPSQLLDHSLQGDQASAYWHWDSELPRRLHITLFAAGEVIFGAFYEFTAGQDLVDHVLGV